MAVGRNMGECFPNASLKSKPDVAKRDVWGWFDPNCLSTCFDNGAGSCWKSDDNSRSRGKGLMMVESCKEGKN